MISRIYWQSPQSFLVALVLLLLALAVTFWLYWGQLRDVPLKRGWALPLLRTLLLGALAMSLLRPSIRTPLEQGQGATVAVLVDQSRSMSVVDRGRSNAELVQLAAALGALPQQVRPSAMSELRNDVDDLRQIVREIERSRSEQRYALLAGRGIETAEEHLHTAQAELRNRVAEIAAVAPAELAEMVSEINRDDASFQIDEVLFQIDELQLLADDRLYSQNEQVRQICADLAEASRIELAQRALDSESGLVQRLDTQRPIRMFGLAEGLSTAWPPVIADGGHGDLANIVQTLRGRLAGERLGAIVLMTDGRRIGGGTNDAGLGSDVPVFVIDMSARIRRDLSITRVWVPQRLFVGQSLTVAVEVKASGYDEEIELVVQSSSNLQTQRITPRDGVAIGRLSLPMNDVGPQEVQIHITPVPDEATIENNSVLRAVKVIGEPIRVAAVAGRATRDFEYLKHALQSDQGIVLTESILEGGKAPPSAEQVLDQDMVVLCDVPPQAMSPGHWDALNRLMTENGGAVMVITTLPALANAYSSNAFTAALLPWRGGAGAALRTWPGEDPVFRIVPARPGGSPLEFSDPLAPGEFRWNRLPPLFGFLALPPLRNEAEALLIERDSGLPVLTRMPLGNGNALFLGLDELWRWQEALPPEDAARFWQEVVHEHITPPFAASNGGMALDVESFRIEPGETTRVRGRSDVPARLEVRLGQDVIHRSRELTTTLPPLNAGAYDIRLIADESAEQVSLPLKVEVNLEEEMRDVSGDEAALRRLAGVRGEVVPLSAVDTLPQRLEKLKESGQAYSEVRLWDSPYLFLFVLACLGLEWSLRKRTGLI